MKDSLLGFLLILPAIWAAILSWNEKIKARRHLTLVVSSAFVLLSFGVTQYQGSERRKLDLSSALIDQKRRLEDEGKASALQSTVAETNRLQLENAGLQKSLIALSEKTLTQSQDIFEQATGADSYPVVTPILVLETDQGFALFLSGVGHGPLLNVSYVMSIGETPPPPSQAELIKLAQAELSGGVVRTDRAIGTVRAGTGRTLPEHIKPAVFSSNVYQFNIETDSGTFHERLETMYDTTSKKPHWVFRYELRRDRGLRGVGSHVLHRLGSWSR